jgi:FAD/FMN-containing dehydrogenase/Fe-S oxidoreductase
MHREIPYNYTSADDRQVVTQLLGPDVWTKLEELRARRVTGRSARLLMRFFGEIAVHQRNAFLYQELIDSPKRRRRLLRSLETLLRVIEGHGGGQPLLSDVLDASRKLLASFRQKVAETPELRARIRRVLGQVIGADNVLFDPITLVSHATDATDWRLHLPLAVAVPGEEREVAPLLRAIGDLGLSAIPRGAGTGLTGGAVPLRPRSVIINTERLNRIRGIQKKDFGASSAFVIDLEAGVITEDAMDHAALRGLVFATDPTSAWACTVGGNISENAGGKTSVLWGTAIDNVLSYRMAMPGGSEIAVHRIGHPLRKILPDDTVRFEVRTKSGEALRTISLGGTEIRKKGLWKDITNKALGGLPGLQKEGTDGVITSAEFVLYPDYGFATTLCLEFFGPDMDEASRVILELSRALPNRGEEALRALEHFDDQYVRAIGYKTKAPRAEAPKAVLVIDVVGHAPEQVERGVAAIRGLLSSHTNTFVFQARDAAEAKRFWADRKKLGAIARRTNAFKLNEDIVLPLESLAQFARFIDEQNLGEERTSQRSFAVRAAEFLSSARPAEDPQWLSEKIPKAALLCEACRLAIETADEKAVRSIDLATRLKLDLLELVRGYATVEEGLAALFAEVRSRHLVIATHMHAGDGNVHVNIPVLSNDRAMMQRAEAIVDRVMERVVRLGGVVSGEHGIGITKLKYLERSRIDELDRYRETVDPAGIMNPGKLHDIDVLDHVYTPSFNLLELEARILSHGSLEELAAKIAQCVRCGRCKPNCCVFHPARSLFFHPRNKNLAIGALVEALLYDAQRERSAGFDLLRHLEQIADHCTICHKCEKPCPVGIDTGEVTVLERRILLSRKFKHTAVATRLVLGYLGSRSRGYNALFRAFVLRLGTFAQRLATRLAGPLLRLGPLARLYPVRMLRSPLPAPDRGTLRAILPRCQPDQVLVFEPVPDPAKTVFYFPGCGSERIFSRVSMAALYLLLKQGMRVVLPPPYLCCGFPAYANARTIQHGRTELSNTILFSQIREMMSYLSFDACVVTCGTCREALSGMDAGKIFGGDVVDLAKYVVDQGLRVSGQGNYLYHAPCHDSLDGGGTELFAQVGDLRATVVPHCCSEAGTLALSRPDIGESMRHRKSVAIAQAMHGRPKGTIMLTNCPSCLQGLGRSAAHGIVPRHVVVELARLLGGDGWQRELLGLVRGAQAIHF